MAEDNHIKQDENNVGESEKNKEIRIMDESMINSKRRLNIIAEDKSIFLGFGKQRCYSIIYEPEIGDNYECRNFKKTKLADKLPEIHSFKFEPLFVTFHNIGREESKEFVDDLKKK